MRFTKTLNRHLAPGFTGVSAGIGWLVALVLAVAYAATLLRYAIDFPWADDFSQILAVPQYVAVARTAKGKLYEVFRLAVEHRIATLRVAALIQAHLLGGLDFRALMFFGSALLLVTGALVASVFDRPVRPLAAAMAAALLSSPANFEAAYWATGALQHLGGAAYAFAALHCLTRWRLAWQLGSVLLGLAAALTSAGGLMVFPVAVLVLLLERRWKSAIGWTLAGAFLFAVYFVDYEAPPYQGSLSTYLHNPWVLPRFFLIALGSMGLKPSVALMLGILLCVAWIWLLVSTRIKSVPPAATAWVAFLFLSFAAISWGRAGFGEAGALLSRYAVYSELAVLVTMAALATQVSSVAAGRLMAIALPLSLAWFLVSWRYDLPKLERFSMERRNELDYYVAEGHALPAPMPPVDFRDFMLKVSRERGFYDPTRARPPHPLVADGRAFDATHPPPSGVETPIVGKRVALVRVHAPGYEDTALLWLKSENHQYRGALDTMPRAPLALGLRTGFLWGLFALTDVAPGTYRLGVSASGAPTSGIAWFDQWVTVE